MAIENTSSINGETNQNIEITYTQDNWYAPWRLGGPRLFGWQADPENHSYGIATLWQTWMGLPIYQMGSYRVSKKDRHNQTWKSWEMSGFARPKPKTIQAQKVPLLQSQIRWVRFWYWYVPVVALLAFYLASSVTLYSASR